MNEIEKMYGLAGVKKITLFKPKHSVTLGDYDEEYVDYPPFTAEKQIELIKWLIQKYKDISVLHKLNLFYINIRDIYTGMVHIEFDETIAGLINNLWQDLTEEEKAEIRKILEK